MTVRARTHATRSAHTGRRVVGLVVAGAFVAAGGLTATTAFAGEAATAATAATPTVTLAWSKHLTQKGKPIALSSPMVATLDSKGSSIVVGDRAGYERAYHLSGGSSVAGWPVSTGGVAVDSTASVLGSGPKAHLFFGEGTSSAPSKGGYRSLLGNGKVVWTKRPTAQPGKSPTAGVMSSLAIGHIQSTDSVIGGSMGQTQLLIDGSSGYIGTGFPWFQADSNFTTPAVATLGLGTKDYIVQGGDSTAGIAFGKRYSNGGHIRILKPSGNKGTGNPGGGLRCEYNTNQVVQSSPAVGTFLRNGAWGVVAGTGSFWKGASDTNKLIAVDSSCKLRWKVDLGGITDSSPALADVQGTGKLAVVQAARKSNGTSTVYAIDSSGSGPHTLWKTTIGGGVYGGPTTADLFGTGRQNVIVPSTAGAYVLDGKTGKVLLRFAVGFAFQNTALLTNDPNGKIGVTLAGYDNQNKGVILHYQFGGTRGSNVNKKGAWPMFHHDQQLTGDATTALPVKP